MPREAFLLALGLLLHVPAAAAPAPAAPAALALHGGPDFGADPPRVRFEDARILWWVLTQ